MPEKRPDRNGKMVTRHVRSAAPTGSSMPLPAPTMGTSKMTAKEATRIIFPDPKRAANKNAKDTISKMSRKMPETLAKVVEVSRADDDVAENMRAMIEYQGIMPDAFLKIGYERAALVYPYAKKMMLLLDPEQAADDDYVREVMFRMEKNVDDLMPAVTISKESLVKAAMLFSFMHGHQDEINPPVNLMWEKYKEAIQYTSSHLEEVEEIAPELMKRKTFSRDAITQLINAPTKSLISGEL